MVGSADRDDVVSAPRGWNKEPGSTVVTMEMPDRPRPDRLGDELVRHLPALRRFAYSLTGSRADAEDLVQASIERALRAQEQWREGTRLDSWLFRIAQNLWRDQKRAPHARTVDLQAAADVEGEDGRDVVAQRSELRAVQRAFRDLPADQQAVLVHVVLRGASYEAAAAVLGVPKGTIMSRLARARAALASKVAGGRP